MEACRIRLKDVEEVRMIKIRNSLNILKDLATTSVLDTVSVRCRCATRSRRILTPLPTPPCYDAVLAGLSVPSASARRFGNFCSLGIGVRWSCAPCGHSSLAHAERSTNSEALWTQIWTNGAPA